MVTIIRRIKRLLVLYLIISLPQLILAQNNLTTIDTIPYNIYPEVNDTKPKLPSPFIKGNEEYVIAVTKENKFAIIPGTLHNNRGICKQLIIDTADFPALVQTGLHSEEKLDQLKTITGWSIDTITKLGRPGGLSYDGFMAEDEDILSVLKNDNAIVKKMGFSHPQISKPLFHVLNMMDADLELNRWNMAKHRWGNIQYFFYNNKKVFVDAADTKGGQKSIFNDNIEGAFHIKIWRDFDDLETKFLKEQYGNLSTSEFEQFTNLLSFINTGEMEPQYIMRYGFYEGHTFWRTDPVAIAFIFGFKNIEELDKIFEGKLNEILVNHFTE